ncbi:MAG: hypothetical protein ACE5HV_01325 [Acidobacteriota bacterium]
MSKPDLLAALEPVLDILERLGVRYQIGGSVASSAHGMARATMDVDLVADLVAEDVAPLVQALEADYFADEEMIRSALREHTSFNFIHQPTMLKIDVFLPKKRPYDQVALERSRLDTLVDEPTARSVPVASPEDIVLQKLEWYRLGGEISERQWTDVLGVLRVQGESLDREYLRRWAMELGIADLLDRALSEA